MKGEGLAILLGGGSKKEAEKEKPGGEEPEGDEDPMDVACEEVFDALKSDDKEAFKAALKSCMDLC